MWSRLTCDVPAANFDQNVDVIDGDRAILDGVHVDGILEIRD